MFCLRGARHGSGRYELTWRVGGFVRGGLGDSTYVRGLEVLWFVSGFGMILAVLSGEEFVDHEQDEDADERDADEGDF